MKFSTDRTHLSFIEHKDFQEVLQLYHEKDTFKYIPHLTDWTNEKYIELLERKILEGKNNIGYYWIARHKQDNSLVGAMNVNKIRNSDKMQVGFQISKKYWHQGYGTELCKGVVEQVITKIRFEELYAVYDIENIASKKILHKSGFEVCREYEEDGIKLEMVQYSPNN